MEGPIISLTEILENKINKEKELEFYYEQLQEIQRKIGFLESDLKLTKKIIQLIESETVIKIKKEFPLIGEDLQ